MTIAISGVGMVSALGADAPSTWARVRAGESGLDRARDIFAGAFEAPPLVGDASVHLEPETSGEGCSRTARFAVQAAREALLASGVDLASSRVGLLVGGTTSGMFETEDVLARLADGSPVTREDLVCLAHHPLSSVTSAVARALGPFTRSQTVSAACASGSVAVAIAATWIELGLVDAVLTGASEGLCKLTLAGFASLGLLAKDGCRPFDRSHDGLSLGEGAGFVVLERSRAVLARGASVLAELRGFAFGTEAHHPTAPDPEAAKAEALLRAALDSAGVEPHHVDAVFAHGTGTGPNDTMEAGMLARVFGASPVVTSQKGQLGHALGASAALETVLAVLAIRDGIVPGTVGFEVGDPARAIAVSRTTLHKPLDVVVKTSFGFGGMDAVLVLSSARSAEALAGGPEAPAVASRPIGLGSVVSIETFDERVAEGPRRRFDRASLLAVSACEAARESGGGLDRADALVYGGAFGRVEGSARFLRRLADKGPRFVRPIEFPNLLPSAQAANVALALGVSGPTFAVSSEPLAAEEAFVTACDLVRAGCASRALACAAEERSDLVERAQRVGKEDEPRARRGREEGAFAAIVTASAATRMVTSAILFEGDPSLAPPEGDRPFVVTKHTPEEASSVLRGTAWGRAPIVCMKDELPTHEASGGATLVRAVEILAANKATCVLVLGFRQGGGTAIVLT